MEEILQKKYPVNANDYRLYEEVGEGVSATVYRALCMPINEIVAIKVLDLEKCNNDLDGIRREVQTMSLIDHPNVLQAHCSFTAGHSLWVVMPYMAGGSCLHIMKTAYPEGFEEPVIATLLREVLRALVYLHAHGHIHRDVKAGNILIDFNGAVKLADFGVSACMFDTGDRQRSRNTFVGTPCWMAPEVMQQLHGYDFKADIWSFGITALELAHGHAPFSKYPPMKVLLMTLQNAPPGLDYERDKRFSKSFKELVAACLVKDPKKRPTSEKLLKHHFFKHARPYEYLSQTILLGLSPLGDRFRVLKAKEADLLLHNKALYGDKEQLSQQEYIRGISAWNFNLDDLKNQAALIPDDDGVPNPENSYMGRKERERNDKVVSPTEWQSPERANNYNGAPIQKDECGDLQSLEDSLASFPIQPLQALKGYFDVAEDDVNASSSCWKDGSRSDCEQQLIAQSSTGATDQSVERNNGEHWVRNSALPRHLTSCHGPKKFFSGSLIHDNAPTKQASNDVDRESQPTHLPERSYSGPLLHRQRRDINNIPTVDDMLEKTVFQRRGRFKVTSEEVCPKVPPANCFLNPVSGGPASPRTLNLPPTSVVSSLQFILQHNNMQREEIVKLIKHVEQASGNGNQMEFVEAGCNGVLQVSPASSREKELQSQVIHLQQSIGGIVEELQRQKMRNSQLEKQLNALMMNKEGTI